MDKLFTLVTIVLCTQQIAAKSIQLIDGHIIEVVDCISTEHNIWEQKPHAANCRWFISCMNNIGIVQQCPDELYFNSETLVCDIPENTSCVGGTTTTEGTTSTTPVDIETTTSETTVTVETTTADDTTTESTTVDDSTTSTTIGDETSVDGDTTTEISTTEVTSTEETTTTDEETTADNSTPETTTTEEQSTDVTTTPEETTSETVTPETTTSEEQSTDITTSPEETTVENGTPETTTSEEQSTDITTSPEETTIENGTPETTTTEEETSTPSDETTTGNETPEATSAQSTTDTDETTEENGTSETTTDQEATTETDSGETTQEDTTVTTELPAEDCEPLCANLPEDGGEVADPTNCNRFISCIDRCRGAKLFCPEDLYFNQLLSVCDLPSRAECTLEVCQGRENGFIPSVNSCRHMYVCIDSNALLEKCGPGLVFDSTKATCVAEDDSNTCVLEEIPEAPEEVQELCESAVVEQLLRHPQYCDVYYRCVRGNLSGRRCGEGLLFDELSGACNLEELAGCTA